MNDIHNKAPNNVTFRSLMTGKQSSDMEQLNLPIDPNKKKNQIEIPSIRFDLKLEKPSSDNFSEFNYNKLCLRAFKAMKRIDKKTQNGITEDNNTPRLTAITKKELSIIDGQFQIEKKRVKDLLSTFRHKIILSKDMDREEADESNEFYEEENTNESEVVQNSKSKKKALKGINGLDLNKFRYADFSHLGKGYDESDSFIDNSDAQDVHIPKNLVPKRGVFYINREKLKLATIDEVKKSKKSTKMENISEQSEDDSEDSEEYSESEESEDEDSEEETSSSDDEMDDDDEESDSGEEDDEAGKKNLVENELNSSNSESVKATVSNTIKKIKKIVEEDEMEVKTEINRPDNNDLTKNKENKVVIGNDQTSANSKKRKNEAQPIEFNNSTDRVQAKITHSNAEFEEIQSVSYKKKKIESNQEQPKSNINTQILNEKNRIVNQPKVEIKSESNDYIDVEEEFQNQTNKPHLNDSSLVNNNLSRSNLTQPLVNQNLPNNLHEDFVALIKKFLDLYESTVSSNSESLSLELKSLLINIYTESKRVKQQFHVFNYLSSKTGRNKDALFRICRRLLTKDNQTNQQNLASTSTSNEYIKSIPVPSQEVKTHNFVAPNIPINMSIKDENDLKIKKSPPGSPQISFNDLTEDLKTKILNLKKEFQIFKQKQEVGKFLENSQVHNLIYLVDYSVRNSKYPNLTRLRDYCISNLADSFEMNKDYFQKNYQIIVNQIKIKNLENTLKNKIGELKREIDAEMPKNYSKYTRLVEEYKKAKSNEQNEEIRKKMNPPRKKFEFTDKIRDLILNIIQIKMAMFRIAGSSPSPQNSQIDASIKLNYIDNFFETELLNLWPKNWMQKNVLLNIYQIKYCQQQQHVQHQRPVSNSHSVSKPSTSMPSTPTSSKQTPNATINISSKNGKAIKIEHHVSSPVASQVPSSKNNMASTPKSINQSVQLINQTKQNVYDNVVNQHKKKTINQIMAPNMDKSHSDEFMSSPNSSRPSKSPQNLFQISNLINSSGQLPDFAKIQQHLNLMLPNFAQNSASLPNLSSSFSNKNPK